MEVAEIRERLKGMHIATVSSATFLARQTLYNFINDDSATPSRSTLKAVSDYIALHDKREAAKKRVRKS